MDTELDLERKIQGIKEERINTANYFEAHNRFKYDNISLMEISYIHHRNIGNLSDDNVYSTHTLLLQLAINNNYPYIKNDIKDPPYFPTSRMEYWVNNEIAHKLLEQLKTEHACAFLIEDSVEVNQELINSSYPPVMWPYIRQANKTKSIGIVTELLKKKCVTNPMRIDIKQMIEPIESINLGRLLAICQIGYDKLSEICWENPTLDSLANSCIDKINLIATQSGYKLPVPKWYDEYDFPTLTTLNQTKSYLLTPDILIPILTNYFNECLTINTPKEGKQTDGKSSNEEEKELNQSSIIQEILKKELLDVIEDVNPHYKGKIQNKTSSPHRLILKVIAIMYKLKTPVNEITWPTVHSFIDKKIYNNHELKTITGLEDINEDELRVHGQSVSKRSCQNNIANYKKKILNIS